MAGSGGASSHRDLRLRLAGAARPDIGGGGRTGKAAAACADFPSIPFPWVLFTSSALCDVGLSEAVLAVPNATAGTAAPAGLLVKDAGVMLGRGGNTCGVSTGRGSEPKGS